jgi:hypothetical protein
MGITGVDLTGEPSFQRLRTAHETLERLIKHGAIDFPKDPIRLDVSLPENCKWSRQVLEVVGESANESEKGATNMRTLKRDGRRKKAQHRRRGKRKPRQKSRVFAKCWSEHQESIRIP